MFFGTGEVIIKSNDVLEVKKKHLTTFRKKDTPTTEE